MGKGNPLLKLLNDLHIGEEGGIKAETAAETIKDAGDRIHIRSKMRRDDVEAKINGELNATRMSNSRPGPESGE
jgi:hypothetical protein